MGSCYGQRQNIIITGLNTPKTMINTNTHSDFSMSTNSNYVICKVKNYNKPILEKLMKRNQLKKMFAK